MLLLLYKDHRNLPWLLSSKLDQTRTYCKDPVFFRGRNEAALVVSLRVGFFQRSCCGLCHVIRISIAYISWNTIAALHGGLVLSTLDTAGAEGRGRGCLVGPFSAKEHNSLFATAVKLKDKYSLLYRTHPQSLLALWPCYAITYVRWGSSFEEI